MKRLKTYGKFTHKVFESVDDIEEIVSTIRDMLLELDDKDFMTSVEYHFNGHPNRDVKYYIVVYISKPAIKHFPHGSNGYYLEPSFEWEDIEDVVGLMMEYLESEEFKYDDISDKIVQNDQYEDITKAAFLFKR